MSLITVLIVFLTLSCANAQKEQFDMECNILQTLDDLQNRLTSAEGVINQQTREITDLKGSLADKDVQITRQTLEIKVLQDSQANAETEITILKAFRTSLESEINRQNLEITALEDSQADAEIEIAHLQAFQTTSENQISRQNTEIGALTDSLTALSSSKGSTFVRWGRTTCPGNGSELVYAGYTGGSDYDHPGAAVDYLCLPKDPNFAHFENGIQPGGYVFGTENRMVYNRGDGMTFFPDNDQSVDLTFQNLPCAVCRTKRSSTLMVPAKTTCHAGWTLEYKGYLSSGGHNNNAASQYFCLDGRPESVPGGAAEQRGKVFHFVEGRCGSLRCPPYVDGRELTCAVCSI